MRKTLLMALRFAKSMRTAIKEGNASIEVYTRDKISKDMPVFYNPAMALNRDLSVLLLRAIGMKKIRVGDVLAGSGVRSIRFLLELPKISVESISINDGGQEANRLIKRNLALNGLSKDKRITITKKDANLAILESSGFDYIDIDPFGSPAPFLDASCKRISRGGIIAITATDTAPLCGTYPRTCLRRYWAMPKKCGMMHEIGLRILIRKAQLIASQYEKALIPLFSYSHEHYFRVFLRCDRGNTAVDAMMKQHGMLDGAGPLWLGSLWNIPLVEKMVSITQKGAGKKKSKTGKNERQRDGLGLLLDIISKEMLIPSAGFHDTHELAKQEKILIPSREKLIAAISKEGFAVSQTHFKGEGLRSTIPRQELIKLMKKIGK